MPMLPVADSRNLLGHETSPYLLQHRDNPVHWRPWGPQALAEARRSQRPILLSIGYAACHWCHVMAQESFEDPAIAHLMNELFVNIKVDREERPDLDQIYQAALALLGQSGGWPLTMFLTPDGEPFWGGTYFPPHQRYGRPGFADVLTGVAESFRREPGRIAGNVHSLKQALAELAQSKGADAVTVPLIDRIAERLVREVDPFHGGIGTAPKFPQAPLFELFWRAWLRTRRRPFRTAVTHTLTAMAQGGIYDHLGGGFARYSTDPEWLVPHFEKMLYDNAQLIELLTLVWQETRDPLYAARVEETVGWVLREMIAAPDADGRTGFASTLDADSEHEEGKFYVWTEGEIDAVLGADSPLFKAVYDVGRLGNWEGKTILNRSREPDLRDGTTERKLAQLRARLLAVRADRVRPGWDDKVLADWNGLMISALAQAGLAFDRPQWVAAAERAFDFVLGTLDRDGRLHHSWRSGRLGSTGTLDDHAAMARGSLALFEATGRSRYLDQAVRWTTLADQHFWDSASGGYFFTPDDGEELIVRLKNIHDNAVPSGNGVMLSVLARLFHLTGDTRYRSRADALIEAFSGEIERNYFPLASFLNGVELLDQAVQILIVGDWDEPGTVRLRQAVTGWSLPNRVLAWTSSGEDLPPSHPAHGKTRIHGRATAYVCRRMTCAAPATTPEELAERLGRH